MIQFYILQHNSLNQINTLDNNNSYNTMWTTLNWNVGRKSKQKGSDQSTNFLDIELRFLILHLCCLEKTLRWRRMTRLSKERRGNDNHRH